MSTTRFLMCRRAHSEQLVAGGTISGTQVSENPRTISPSIGPIVQRLNCGVVKLGGIEQLYELWTNSFLASSRSETQT